MTEQPPPLTPNEAATLVENLCAILQHSNETSRRLPVADRRALLTGVVNLGRAIRTRDAEIARLRTEAAALYDEARYGRDVAYSNGFRWAGEVTPYPDNPYRNEPPHVEESIPPAVG